MSKTIFFILDSFELYDFHKLYNGENYICCYSYFDTEQAIENKITNIITYDIGHLSFDLETLEYKIFIGYNGKYVHFTVGMSTANGKELRFAHNLRRLLISGALDNDLGIERNKFYYDNFKSTHELCETEKEKQLFSKQLFSIFDKTIASDLCSVKAMTAEESYEWHNKHARIDPKTGNLIISDDEIGDGSYEQKYGHKIIK